MGIPSFSTVLNFASDTMLPVHQSRLAAEEEEAAARANAELLEARAGKKDDEAEAARALGFLDQADQAGKGRKEIAGRRARYAASGVRVDTGSALEVAADAAAWSEYERQRIEYDADLESWGLRYDAALLRAEAAAARAGVTG